MRHPSVTKCHRTVTFAGLQAEFDAEMKRNCHEVSPSLVTLQ